MAQSYRRKDLPPPVYGDSPGHMANTEWLFRADKQDGSEPPTVITARKRAAQRATK